MQDKSADLKGELQDYKKTVSPTMRAMLDWDKDLVFTGRTSTGYAIEFDARVEWGCMPTEALLISLAACLAIDVVSFLKKMRCKISSYRMEINAERNPTPPQYFKAVDMKLIIKGAGLEDRKVERAVNLSQEKYCSVRHSLRPDLKVNVAWELEEEAGGQKGA